MKIHPIAILVAGCLMLAACQSSAPKKAPLTEDQLEAIEDSLEFIVSRDLQTKITAAVQADVETNAVTSPQVDDDAADDMAVWVNATNPEKSILVGSNKKGGVVVFDLEGKELAFYPTGRINNIDVTYGFPMGKEKIDLVGCTNRTEQSINLFRINPTDGKLEDIAAHKLLVDTNMVKDVYGFCFYHSDKHYLFLNGKNGAVQQFEIIAAPNQKLDLKLVRTIKFDSQTEGMVADEDYKVLYIGEEDKGIWKVAAEPGGDNKPVLLEKSGEDNPNITFDVEGLALYKKNGDGYLLASSQGNFSYAVFERKGTNAYVASFKVEDGPQIDGVEETDGIEVISTPLGSAFPQGMFLAQDGYNYDKGKLQRQNFKLVRWEKIEQLLRNPGK
jgi:3-phytase